MWNLWDYCCFQENFAIIFRLFNVIFFTAFGIVIRILSFKKGKKKKDKHGHSIYSSSQIICVQ